MGLILYTCRKLRARISEDQCRVNRSDGKRPDPRLGPVSNHRPPQCATCLDWQEFGSKANPGEQVNPGPVAAKPPAPQSGAKMTAPLPSRVHIPSISIPAVLPAKNVVEPMVPNKVLGSPVPHAPEMAHKELPMCGCTRLMAGCPESLDMAAYDALCREVRALVATGHTRVGLERLRAMVSPKLDKPMTYWPWRDLVEASGFTITKSRPGHPAEVVLQ